MLSYQLYQYKNWKLFQSVHHSNFFFFHLWAKHQNVCHNHIQEHTINISLCFPKIFYIIPSYLYVNVVHTASQIFKYLLQPIWKYCGMGLCLLLSDDKNYDNTVLIFFLCSDKREYIQVSHKALFNKKVTLQYNSSFI